VVGTKGQGDESGEKQVHGYEKKERQRLNQPEDAELARASGKVLSDMGTDMRCVIPSNCMEIPVGPLLQKRGQKCAHEAEHEAEEPD